MLQKIHQQFLRLVHAVEEHPAGLGRYVQLFFAILALRLSLEFFSSQRLFNFADILHIGLWFGFIVLAFLLQLHLFSGESLRKTIKLAIVGFTIALSAPVIDLLISGGVGAKMNYLSLNRWQDVVYAYFTIGGPSLARGATIGIRIEIVLLVLATFNYVRIKRGSVGWGIAAAWSIYTVLFLSGAVPKLLGMLVAAFHLQYGPQDQSTILLLLVLDLVLIAAILIAYQPQKAKLLLQSIPFGALGLALGLFALGAALGRQAYPRNWQLDPTTLFWFPLLGGIVGVFAGILAANRLESRGELSATAATKLRNVLLVLGLAMSWAMSEQMILGFGLIWGLGYMQAESPLNLRKLPVLRNLLLAMHLTATALFGFSMMGAPMVGFPTNWLLPLLLFLFLGSFILEWESWPHEINTWYSRAILKFALLFKPIAFLLFALATLSPSIFFPAPIAIVVPMLCMIAATILIWKKSHQTQLIISTLIPIFVALIWEVMKA